MPKFKLEYIWLDGYTPTPNLRGKTQLKDFDSFPTLEQLPLALETHLPAQGWAANRAALAALRRLLAELPLRT